MSGMPTGSDVTALFSRSGALGTDVDDLASAFSGLDDRALAVAEAVSNFDGSDPISWDKNLFSPMSLVGSTSNIVGDQESTTTNTNGSLSPPDDEDPVSTLNHQLTRLNARIMHAIRCIALPGSSPPTVNSPLVNEAFEATSALIRIISSIPDLHKLNTTGDMVHVSTTAGPSPMASGLVFQVLASHQHLLGLFKAICDSVDRCVEAMIVENKQHQRGLHGEGPSSAQSVMVLQLLMHLISRMDQSLFITPASLENDTQELTTYQARTELAETKVSQSIPVIAQVLASTLPEEHVKLKRVIQMLLTRIEVSNIL
jgi:hypothetical protein